MTDPFRTRLDTHADPVLLDPLCRFPVRTAGHREAQGRTVKIGGNIQRVLGQVSVSLSRYCYDSFIICKFCGSILFSTI